MSRRDPSELLAKARRANREKKRRQLARRRAGLRVYRVEMNEADLVAALTDAGLLAVIDGENHVAVERAIQKMLLALIG